MRRLVFPLLPVVATVGLAVASPDALPRVDAVRVVAWVAAVVVALDLARRVRSAATAWSAALLLLLVEAASRVPAAEVVAWSGVAAALVAVDVALAAVLRPPGPFSPSGLAGFAVLAAQAVTVAALARGALSWLAAPLAGVLAPSFLAGTRLAAGPWPPGALVAVLAGAATLAVLVLRRRRGVDAGLLGAVLAVAGGAWLVVTVGVAPALAVVCGGILALLVGVVEDAFSLAFEDSLTGLPGRRALEERLRELGRRYTVAMVDLDRFKQLNDRHGHEAGDQVLRMVAACLAGVGGGGTAYRYGGEEFTVLFPGKATADAKPHLDALRQTIAGRRFAVRSRRRRAGGKNAAARRGSGGAAGELKVTVSIGVAEGDGRRRPRDVMKRADKALYKAKRAGRNRVVVG